MIRLAPIVSRMLMTSYRYTQQAAELTQQAKSIQQAIGCSNIGGMPGQTNQLLNNVGPGGGGDGDDNNDDDNP